MLSHDMSCCQFFLSKCHSLQTMILNNTFLFPPSIKESLNDNLYLGIGSFQRFFSTYHHPYTIGYFMMKSSNFDVGSTRKPPPWPGLHHRNGSVPALIVEAKGRGHSTCEGWVKNHGKPTKETLELFF